MTEEGAMLDSNNLELVTYYDNSIINVSDGDIFSGNEKIQVLTLEEARAQGWNINLKDNNVEFIEPYTPPAVTPNPPIIEEENSSDNFPAIGHLEGFEIQTANDGTLLPSTVNAKMADGTYRRLTLFPQLVDGNVTCMVHFENDVTQIENIEEDPKHTSISEKIDNIICRNENKVSQIEHIEERPKLTSISEKIDNIICRNENIVSNSKMIHMSKQSKLHPITKATKVRRQEAKPKDTQALPRNSSLYFPIKEAIEPIYYNRFKDSLKKTVNTNKKPNLLPMNKSTLLRTTNQPNKKRYMPSNQNKIILENAIHSPISVPKKSDEPDIFIKTNPELTKIKNIHPLGSTENPITLLQNGQVYTSNQSLSEMQLQQVSAILKKERCNIGSSVDKNFFIDPRTNSKIVYRVVYPEEEPKPEQSKPKRATGKRPRQKIASKQEEIVKEPKNVETAADEEVAPDIMASPPPKIMKLPRTRSGRLSRPPRHITQDFKRLQINGHVPSKFPEADLYVDYKSLEEVPPALPTPQPMTDLNSLGRVRKKKQFKSKYRCPTCQKVYLGHSKMMLHLRKFPDHSNLDEYVEIYERARTELKFRTLNLCKLKKILSGVNKTSYGPLLAKAFTIWDFVLLKISSANHSGEEVETLIKELSILIEKVKRVTDELLQPIYGRDKEPSSVYVLLDKIEVSNLLGLEIGTYKVNKERLHLLRLANEEAPPPPPPPLPRPTQLATKFEPNLSNKLLDCSNDSIDMDCSSKDVESGDDKKDWHETDFSEFLQNQLPTECSDSLALWKSNNGVHVSPQPVLPSKTNNDLTLWKEDKSTEPEIWKTNDNDSAWKNNKNSQNHLWKGTDSSVAQLSSWREGENEPVVEDTGNWRKENKKINDLWKKVAVESSCSAVASEPPSSRTVSKINEQSEGEEASIWDKKSADPWDGNEKEGKKDWLRQWKEDAGVPGLRSTRLTSTPETHVAPNALFSPPIRRNSVSSFALNPQEELLGLDLHDLFDELMPDQTKSRPPKPTIESIINEAFFTETPAVPSHTSLPQLIPGALDEVANLDFLVQD